MKLLRLLPLLLASACSENPAGVDRGDVRVNISVDPAAPAPEHNVDVVVRNEGDRPIYVLNDCGNLVAWHIERRVAGGWVNAPYPILCAAYTPPVELEPGESTSSTVPVHEAGRYRATVRITESPDAPLATEVREEFTVGS